MRTFWPVPPLRATRRRKEFWGPRLIPYFWLLRVSSVFNYLYFKIVLSFTSRADLWT
ncbi:hypothetical protein BS47DRAFT_1351039 [Hydnum rufescens UP504]|uniref:Uncharacterized protein n=1 Tax=Hydnum rufescens UP504 TaxID=1448309 RepID=A0A9P6AL61_9AGAM|nr:hypothetical protein BS47DRAFT_1351039 [Hydnum rufescens UP504]